MDRLPVQFGGFLDRLGAKFWRADIDQDISARRLQLDDMRFDGGLARFVSLLRSYHRAFLAQSVFDSLQQILAVVVVLKKNTNPATRMILQDVFGIDPAFCVVAWHPSHR